MRILQARTIFLILTLAPGIASGSYHLGKTDAEIVPPYSYNSSDWRPEHELILAEHEEENIRGGNSHKRAKRWEELTPKQRRRIEKRYEKYKSLPPVEQERIKKAREQYRDLPPEKRREIRDQYRKSKRKRDER